MHQQQSKRQILEELPRIDIPQATLLMKNDLLRIERDALALNHEVEYAIQFLTPSATSEYISRLHSHASKISKELVQLKERAIQTSISLLGIQSSNRDLLAGHLWNSELAASYPWVNIFGGTMLVKLLGDIYDNLNAITSNASQVRDKNVSWNPPSSFERSTHKYWVEPQSILDVMLKCTEEVPVLVYGKEGDESFDVTTAMRQDLWETLSTSITSIYFDSRDDLTLYKDRIARIESAQLFRVRWYNAKPSGNDHIFLELKTHHEQWVLDESIKERVAIRAKDFSSVLRRDGKRWNDADAEKLLLAAKPNLSGDGLATATDLLLRIRKLIIKKNLEPFVRSSYRRVAFQSNTNNALRFTIDRDIELSSEMDAPLGHWCRPCEDAYVAKVMMPISVFEVKLNGTEAPEWVSTLLNESKILDGHKFSKYLSGASMLCPEKVPILPYWAGDPIFCSYYNEKFQRSKAHNQNYEMMCLTQQFRDQKDVEACTLSLSDGENQSNESNGSTMLKRRNGTQTRSKFLKLLNFRKKNRSRRTNNVASKDRVRVEPKTYFAAERTFIQWISAALLLITISALLFSLSETQNAEGPRFNGLILIFVATFVTVYALIVYFRRLFLMKNRKTYGYTDHFAPVILTVAVLAGIISILYHGMGDLYYGKGMYEVEGDCTNVAYTGISLLEFQPSDVSIDRERGISYIATNNEIATMKLDSLDNPARVRVAGSVIGGDLEGIVLVDDVIFAVSEDSMLYAFDADSAQDDAMEMVGSWKLQNGIQWSEGIAHHDGKLYISSLTTEGTKEVSNVYVVPVPVIDGSFDAKLFPMYHLNEKLMMNDGQDVKIGALQIFEGSLYVLYDNARVIRQFDLASGNFISEMTLPHVGYSKGKFDKQWEGMFLERIANDFATIDDDTVATKQQSFLRATSNAVDVAGSQDEIRMTLALDSPPEIWTFNMVQTNDGRLKFPKCAVAK